MVQRIACRDAMALSDNCRLRLYHERSRTANLAIFHLVKKLSRIARMPAQFDARHNRFAGDEVFDIRTEPREVSGFRRRGIAFKGAIYDVLGQLRIKRATFSLRDKHEVVAVRSIVLSMQFIKFTSFCVGELMMARRPLVVAGPGRTASRISASEVALPSSARKKNVDSSPTTRQYVGPRSRRKLAARTSRSTPVAKDKVIPISLRMQTHETAGAPLRVTLLLDGPGHDFPPQARANTKSRYLRPTRGVATDWWLSSRGLI
jgi:hypothetical protein